MKTWLVLTCVLIPLGGCGVDDWINRMNAERFRKQCVSLGLTPGSNTFDNCMLQQSAQDAEKNQRIQDRVNMDEAIDRLKK